MNSLSLSLSRTNPVLIEGLEPRRLFASVLHSEFQGAYSINQGYMTVSWSGLDSSGKSHGSTAVSLTLGNLPAHTHRDLLITTSSHADSGAVTGSLGITLDSAFAAGRTFSGSNASEDVYADLAIESDSNGTATIQFTPSGLNAGIETSFFVGLDLTQSEITIPHYPDLDEPTVGEVRLVHVNVKDYQSNPIAGDSVVLTSDNPAVVEVLSGPVTTDANGVAVVQIISHDDTSYVNLVATSSFGGQKIDYTRGRWPGINSFSVTDAHNISSSTSVYGGQQGALMVNVKATAVTGTVAEIALAANTWPFVAEGNEVLRYRLVGPDDTVLQSGPLSSDVLTIDWSEFDTDDEVSAEAWVDRDGDWFPDSNESVSTIALSLSTKVHVSENSTYTIWANVNHPDANFSLTFTKGTGTLHYRVMENNELVEKQFTYTGVADGNGIIIGGNISEIWIETTSETLCDFVKE